MLQLHPTAVCHTALQPACVLSTALPQKKTRSGMQVGNPCSSVLGLSGALKAMPGEEKSVSAYSEDPPSSRAAVGMWLEFRCW